MIATLTVRPELRLVELFEAGVEPQNIASRRCLEAAGFQLRSVEPDFEVRTVVAVAVGPVVVTVLPLTTVV